MPDVISNTSPIQYLYQTNLLDFLPNLYRSIIVPQAVADELEKGRSLGVSLPVLTSLSWIDIVAIESTTAIPDDEKLGLGEKEVMALAQSKTDTLVLLDDGLARVRAQQLGIQLTGTLGVILKGKQLGYVKTVKPILDRLDGLGFRVSRSTRSAVLKVAGEDMVANDFQNI